MTSSEYLIIRCCQCEFAWFDHAEAYAQSDCGRCGHEAEQPVSCCQAEFVEIEGWEEFLDGLTN